MPELESYLGSLCIAVWGSHPSYLPRQRRYSLVLFQNMTFCRKIPLTHLPRPLFVVPRGSWKFVASWTVSSQQKECQLQCKVGSYIVFGGVQSLIYSLQVEAWESSLLQGGCMPFETIVQSTVFWSWIFVGCILEDEYSGEVSLGAGSRVWYVLATKNHAFGKSDIRGKPLGAHDFGVDLHFIEHGSSNTVGQPLH